MFTESKGLSFVESSLCSFMVTMVEVGVYVTMKKTGQWAKVPLSP